MRKALIFILTVVILASCDTTKNQIISLDNIEASVLKIKEDKDLDSIKIDALDELVSLSKGRDEYIKARLKNLDSENLEKFLIDEDKFRENTDNLFKYFNENKITYKILLTEIDTLIGIKERYDKRLTEVNRQIDEYCSKKQKDVDEKGEKSRSN